MKIENIKSISIPAYSKFEGLGNSYVAAQLLNRKCLSSNIPASNEVNNIFKSWGLVVNPAQRTMKPIYKDGKVVRFISQSNDLWGLFDGMAKDTHRTYYYQVKRTHVIQQTF